MGHLFISHARSDRSQIEQLLETLEKNSGRHLWIDVQDISAGELWRTSIVAAIKAADAFIIVLSRTSVDSDHVRTELDIAHELKIKIIPVLIDEVDIPDEMIYPLAGRQNIDLTKRDTLNSGY